MKAAEVDAVTPFRKAVAFYSAQGTGTLQMMDEKSGERMQLKHMESCRGEGDKPVESLWVQIRGEANKGEHLKGIFYRLGRAVLAEGALESVFSIVPLLFMNRAVV